MPSSAEARMGVRVALTGLWAGSGGTGDFSDQRVQTAQFLHRGPSLLPATGGWGGGRRKSNRPSPATSSDPDFPTGFAVLMLIQCCEYPPR